MPKIGSAQAQFARDIERLEVIVRWLAETVLPNPDMPCINCGHGIEEHLDGDDDSTMCLWPTGHGAPVTMCRCIAYRG